MARKIAVIALHGRGQSAMHFRWMISKIGDLDIELSVPQAHGGQWYPHSFLAPLANNEPELGKSLDTVDRHVKKFLGAGYRAEQIALMGFSQGGALACEYIGRAQVQTVGGVIAWFAGRIGPLDLVWPERDGMADMSILCTGSDIDEFVPGDRTRKTADHFLARGANVVCRMDDRPHAVDATDLYLARQLLSGMHARCNALEQSQC